MSPKAGVTLILLVASLVGCAPVLPPKEIDHVGTVYRAIRVDWDHVLLDGQYDLTISNIRTGKIVSSVKTNVWAVDAIHISERKELWTGVPGGLAVYNIRPDLTLTPPRHIDIDKKSGLIPSVVLESDGELFVASNLSKAVVIRSDGSIKPIKTGVVGRISSYISRPNSDYAFFVTEDMETRTASIVVISMLNWKIITSMPVPPGSLIAALDDRRFLVYDWAGRAIPQEIEFKSNKLVKSRLRTELGKVNAISVSDSGKLAAGKGQVVTEFFEGRKKPVSNPNGGDSLLWVNDTSLIIVRSNIDARCLTVPK